MSARRGDPCLSCGGDRADAPRDGCKYPPNHARAVSEPYTPTTDEVRNEWVARQGPFGGAALAGDEFDRWIRAEKAKAWDEGASKGHALYETSRAEVLRRNPYREEP